MGNFHTSNYVCFLFKEVFNVSCEVSLAVTPLAFAYLRNSLISPSTLNDKLAR